MTKEFDYSPIDKILENHEKTAVIAILQDIQEIYHYLPKEIFPYLAKKLGTGEARIYSVATFYENFSLEPKGKYVIKCCDGTACHVRKSIPILEYLRGELGLSEKKSDVHSGNCFMSWCLWTCPCSHCERCCSP